MTEGQVLLRHVSQKGLRNDPASGLPSNVDCAVRALAIDHDDLVGKRHGSETARQILFFVVGNNTYAQRRWLHPESSSSAIAFDNTANDAGGRHPSHIGHDTHAT